MTPHDPRGPDHVHGPAVDFDAVYREAPTDRVFSSPFNGGYWVLTKAEDVRAALQAPEVFSSAATGRPAHPSRREKMYPLELDPPEHRPHRQVLTPFFAPKAVVAKAQAEIRMHGGGAMGIVRLDLRWPPTDSGQR